MDCDGEDSEMGGEDREEGRGDSGGGVPERLWWSTSASTRAEE
jgi:hypothetical protein